MTGRPREALNKGYDTGYYTYLDTAGAVFDYAAAELRRTGCRSIVDVGCWHCNLLQRFEPGELIQFVGFDLCDKAIAAAIVKYRQYSEAGFYVHSWDNVSSLPKLKADGMYLGGVLYYISDKPSFVQDLCRHFRTKTLVVQDLLQTNLDPVAGVCRQVARRDFDFKFEGKADYICHRQVRTFLCDT